MIRVLLTGAGGFAGSHMLRHILDNKPDWEVVCPVTFTHKGLSDRIRLAMDDIPEAAARVHVIRCDLASPISSVTDNKFGSIDYVFNYASESHVDRSIAVPGQFIQNNVAIMTNLLDWVVYRQDPIFIQVSTDEVYGPAPIGIDHREWVDQHLPSNPYAASKAAQEDIAFAYWRTYGIPVILTNTMNLIGETQNAEKFVPRVIKSILDEKTMLIHSSPDGVPGSRFYLHARNQADGILHILQHVTHNINDRITEEALVYGSFEGNRPYRFNIVGEREVSNFEMAQMISKMMDRPLLYELVDFHSSRPGHDLRYALDGTKLAQTGWKPKVPLESSLAKLVGWTLQHPEWLL